MTRPGLQDRLTKFDCALSGIDGKLMASSRPKCLLGEHEMGNGETVADAKRGQIMSIEASAKQVTRSPSGHNNV